MARHPRALEVSRSTISISGCFCRQFRHRIHQDSLVVHQLGPEKHWLKSHTSHVDVPLRFSLRRLYRLRARFNRSPGQADTNSRHCVTACAVASCSTHPDATLRSCTGVRGAESPRLPPVELAAFVPACLSLRTSSPLRYTYVYVLISTYIVFLA